MAETEPAHEASAGIEISIAGVEDVAAADEPDAPVVPTDVGEVGKDLGPHIQKPLAYICQL
jgi:hypothetical protein